MRKPLACLALLILLANAAVTQAEVSGNPSATGFIAPRLDRISDAITHEVESGKIPGAVALIVRNGNIAYLESFGYADIDSETTMQNDSIFRIASMSKAVTTVAIMTLYEQGYFQLNDPIAKYIPAFADMSVVSAVDDEGNAASTVAATNPIRIIDLLTHTSGIGYPFIGSSVQKFYTDAGVINGLTSSDITLASQMALLAQQPLMFEPGSRYAYGLSTDLLGYLVEVISGRSLSEYFTEEIFTPLEMRDSFFYLPQEKADRLVTMYSHVEGSGLIEWSPDESEINDVDPLYPVRGAKSYYSGGAGLSSTAYDYGRFLQMLLNDGELEGARILSRKSVELMRTARVDWDSDGQPDAALGFSVTSDLGKKGELGSVGSYSWGGAFYTSYWVDPKEDLVGVFMSQARPVDSDIRTRFSTLVYQALE